MGLREIKINRTFILREDGKLFHYKTGKEFKPAITARGFRRLVINYITYSIGHLVLDRFKEPYPGKDYIVHHIDGNSLNDNIDNLEWKPLKISVEERKEKRRLQKMRYSLRHREERNAYSRDYYRKHPELKEYYRNYEKTRPRNKMRDMIYYNSPERKEYDNTRAKIYRAIKKD